MNDLPDEINDLQAAVRSNRRNRAKQRLLLSEATAAQQPVAAAKHTRSIAWYEARLAEQEPALKEKLAAWNARQAAKAAAVYQQSERFASDYPDAPFMDITA